MIREIFISLVNNTALLLALNLIYTVITFKNVKMTRTKSMLIGCVIGLIGISIMSSPFKFIPGLTFDTRSILISVTGLFWGLIPTLITVTMTSIYRIYQGGIGVITGISVIMFSAVLGLIWHYFRLNNLLENKENKWIELYLFGILNHIGMLVLMLTLPWEMAISTLKNITIPVIAIYPFGTVLLSIIIINQIDRYKTYSLLEESEERYRSLFENNHAVMLLIDPKTGDIVDANPAACIYYGKPNKEMRKMNINELNTLSEQEIEKELESAYRSKKNYFNFKHKLPSNNIIRDVEVYSGPICVNGKKILYSIIHDVTDKIMAEAKLKQSEELFRVTLLSVGDGVITTNKNGIITMINTIGEDITGWKRKDAVGTPVKEVFNIINEYTREKVEDPVQKVLDNGIIIGLANHTILICKDGTEKPIADSAAPIRDKKGNILGVVLVIRDATAERKKQEEIVYLGYHDSLTGLYNRRFFDEEIKRIDTISNLPISIIIGDVNGLKLTNDAFGHEKGDKLLREMANSIMDVCNEDNIVTRWGGDEFIILLPNSDSAEAEKVCKNIKINCSKVKMECIDFSISLGYETKYNINEDIKRTIKRAEDYMYRRKSMESSSMRGNAINTILYTLHEKNPREQLHSNRVSELCKEIGTAMKLSEKEISELSLCGLLHDIGKITVSERILDKEGALTQEEWSEIRRHPMVGFRILSESDSMSYIAKYVLEHHERLDGSGYPNGLKGTEISLYSKILAVADAYDAMVSDRPYRKALSVEMAVAELNDKAGSQFDPTIVKVLIEKVINIK